MTDFERNSTSNAGRDQLKRDPLLELTRLFDSGKDGQEEQDIYQSGDYSVSEEELLAYPALDQEQLADYEQAFLEEGGTGLYNAGSGRQADTHPSFLLEEDADENAAAIMRDMPDNMAEPAYSHAVADITGDIIAQAFRNDDYEEAVSAESISPFWPQDKPQQHPVADDLLMPRASGDEGARVRQAFHPAEMAVDDAAPLSDSSLSPQSFTGEWQYSKQQQDAVPEPETDGAFGGAEQAYGGFEVTAEGYGEVNAAFSQSPQAEPFYVDNGPRYVEQAAEEAETPYAPYVQAGAREELAEDFTGFAAHGVFPAGQADVWRQENAFVAENADAVYAGKAGQAEQRSADEQAGADSVELLMNGPEVDTVSVENNRVEDTASFDLPLPDYAAEIEVEVPVHAELEQEFADIFDNGFQQMTSPAAVSTGPEEPYYGEQHQHIASQEFAPQQAVTEETAFHGDESEKASGVYDWNATVTAGAAEAYAVQKLHRGGLRKWIYRLGALTVVIAAGAGAYVYFSPMEWSGDSTPVVIHAEPGDVRVMPEASGKDTQASTAGAVYDQVAGDAPASAEQKQLVDKTEAPLDMAATDQGSEPAVDGQNALADEAQPPQSTESGVDTLSIDSLIADAASKSLPVQLVPTVKVQPGQETVPAPAAGDKTEVLVAGKSMPAQQELQANSNSGTQDDVAAIMARDSGSLQTAPEEAAVKGNAAAKQSASVQNTTQNEQRAAARDRAAVQPAASPDLARVQPVVPAAKARQAQTQAAASAATPSSGFYVQVASQPSEAAARQSAQNVKTRFASIIGGNQIVIVSAAIPGKGTYYRVRIPVDSRAAASDLCGRYQQAGGSCLVVNE